MQLWIGWIVLAWSFSFGGSGRGVALWNGIRAAPTLSVVSQHLNLSRGLSVPVHSCLFPDYCFLFLSLLLPPPTVPWGMVVWPYHLIFSLNSKEGRFVPSPFPNWSFNGEVFKFWREFISLLAHWKNFILFCRSFMLKNIKIEVIRLNRYKSLLPLTMAVSCISIICLVACH